MGAVIVIINIVVVTVAKVVALKKNQVLVYCVVLAAVSVQQIQSTPKSGATD